MAMSPQTKALLDSEARQFTYAACPIGSEFGILGIPYIVDPRISDGSEVFYDHAAWQARCAEQRAFDQKAA